MIYDTDDTCIIYRSKYILDGFICDHPADVMLDYPWEDKNLHITLLVSESKEAIKKAVFEWNEYYISLFNTDGLVEENALYTSKRYE